MFKCSGCGLCCKKIDVVVALTEHVEELKFPYKHENGVCEKLTDDGKCSVYSDRPLICNVDKFAEHFNLDKGEFYKINEDACKMLQNEN